VRWLCEFFSSLPPQPKVFLLTSPNRVNQSFSGSLPFFLPPGALPSFIGVAVPSQDFPPCRGPSSPIILPSEGPGLYSYFQVVTEAFFLMPPLFPTRPADLYIVLRFVGCWFFLRPLVTNDGSQLAPPFPPRPNFPRLGVMGDHFLSLKNFCAIRNRDIP